MPKVRHKESKNTEVVLGSVVVSLNEEGVGEVPQEYYNEVISGRLKNWEVAEIVRKSTESSKDESPNKKSSGKSDEDDEPPIPLAMNTTALLAIETIAGISELSQLDAYIEGETRKTVVDAYTARKATFNS